MEEELKVSIVKLLLTQCMIMSLALNNTQSSNITALYNFIRK